MKKPIKIALIITSVVLVVGVLFSGSVKASDSAKPGDPLYALDMFGEDIQRVIILSPTSASEFERKVLEERINELEELIDEGESEELVGELLNELEVQIESVSIEIDADEDLDPAEKLRIQNEIREQLSLQYEMLQRIMNKYSDGDVGMKRVVEKFKVEFEDDGVKIEVEYELEDKDEDSNDDYEDDIDEDDSNKREDDRDDDREDDRDEDREDDRDDDRDDDKEDDRGREQEDSDEERERDEKQEREDEIETEEDDNS